jgi:hypothetical protein
MESWCCGLNVTGSNYSKYSALEKVSAIMSENEIVTDFLIEIMRILTGSIETWSGWKRTRKIHLRWRRFPFRLRGKWSHQPSWSNCDRGQSASTTRIAAKRHPKRRR